MFEPFTAERVQRMNVATLLRYIEQHQELLAQEQQVEVVRMNLMLLYEKYAECVRLGLINPELPPVPSISRGEVFDPTTTQRREWQRRLNELLLVQGQKGRNTPPEVNTEIEDIRKLLG